VRTRRRHPRGADRDASSALAGADHLGTLLQGRRRHRRRDAHHGVGSRAAVPSRADQGDLFDPPHHARARGSASPPSRQGRGPRPLEAFLRQPHRRRRPGPAPARRAARGRRALRADGARGAVRPRHRQPALPGHEQAGRQGLRARRSTRGARPTCTRRSSSGACSSSSRAGVSALLTMRNWMFIKQFSALREWLLATYDLRALGDVDRGAFEEVPTSWCRWW
jgi:hypothetical protein